MKCENCNKKFINKKLFNIHVEKRACYPKVCEICNKSFRDTRDLKRHEETLTHIQKLKEQEKMTENNVLVRIKQIQDEQNQKISSLVETYIRANPNLDPSIVNDLVKSLGISVTNNNVTNNNINITNHFHLSKDFLSNSANYLYRMLGRGMNLEEILKKSFDDDCSNHKMVLSMDGEMINKEDTMDSEKELVPYKLQEVLTEYKAYLKEKLDFAKKFCKDNCRELRSKIREKEVDDDDKKHNGKIRKEIEEILTRERKVDSMLMSIPSLLTDADIQKIDKEKLIEEFLRTEREIDQIIMSFIKSPQSS